MNILSNQKIARGHLLALEGELDAQGCKDIRDVIELTAQDCTDTTLFLDLHKVTFMDSSGVGAIVFLFKRLTAADAQLQVVNVHGQPKELLSLLRVNEAIPVSWYDENNAADQNLSAH